MPIDPSSVPIDPVSMAAASLLAMKALESAATEAGKTSWKGLERLAGVVKEKFRQSDQEGQAALTMVETRPNDKARVELLAQVLHDRAAGDSRFASVLNDIVNEARMEGIMQLNVKEAGLVAGRDVKQVGHTNIGRDQINYPPSRHPN
jgi:hypothetical protein